MSLPTYSLLEKHDETIVYRVPHPDETSSAWVRIGLFPWKLEGEKPVRKPNGDPDTILEQAEGTGINIQYHTPSRHHPRPKGFKDHVSERYETFSRGHGDKGASFRLQETNATELRQLGRWLCVYGFSYWWWLENHTDYPLGKRGTRDQMRTPTPDTILQDGTVIERDGTRHESPYSLADVELLQPEDWQSPYEEVHDALVDTLREFDDVPAHMTRNAVHDVARDFKLDPVEKTPEKRKREELQEVLRGLDGIGRRTRQQVLQEFDSVSDLITDIQNGSTRLRDVSAIGDGRAETIQDAVMETDAWNNQE